MQVTPVPGDMFLTHAYQWKGYDAQIMAYSHAAAEPTQHKMHSRSMQCNCPKVRLEKKRLSLLCCRWVQGECSSLGDMDAPEVNPRLHRAAQALRERQVLFRYCAEEVATARHNAMFQRCGCTALLWHQGLCQHRTSHFISLARFSCFECVKMNMPANLSI